MNDPAFDYRAYQPLALPKLRPAIHKRPRPQLVVSRPDIQHRPDELAQQLAQLRGGLALADVASILGHRFLTWVDSNILQNIMSAWVVAAFGWGSLIGVSIVQYFMR